MNRKAAAKRIWYEYAIKGQEKSRKMMRLRHTHTPEMIAALNMEWKLLYAVRIHTCTRINKKSRKKRNSKLNEESRPGTLVVVHIHPRNYKQVNKQVKIGRCFPTPTPSYPPPPPHPSLMTGW